ncbi:hypothetical protein MFLAVUS_005016 [Mucor flavus]|uniref:Uncharacterized protein n=1 Tax=Mucor flavus TaxID=439312 RepID=A0ABP9YXL0_9FUNG
MRGNSYITYDKQKSKVLSWGEKYNHENEDTVQIDISGERLYRLFKKGKDSWNPDDLFLFKAVSDFISLFVKQSMANTEPIRDTDAFHYVFAVPSEWEEEIREVLIRPIFVQANVISENVHKYRLLFCTDIESICYYLTQYQIDDRNLSRNTIIGVINILEENKVMIVLNSIMIENPLFDCSNSLLFPTLVASNSSFLTTNDVKNGIREFIKIKFFFNAQEETIQNIMEEVNRENSYRKLDEDEYSYFDEPFLNDKYISELDKKHAALITSIRPIDICAEISKHLPNNLKLLVQNDLVKNEPRILSTEHSATSSSIFLKSKPDAILNIGISFESTMLSYSLLDENGLVKEIWDHDYFVSDIQFIMFVDEKLSTITVDSMLLKRLFGTEDDLRDVIYTSNLVQKDDSSKKLRIATNAEGLFPVIQRSFNLQFPLKSFFVVAQLYEEYVQLTLNQVVTESGLENEYQEAIIMQEEIIPIPSICDTLCFNMWTNITEDNSLIQLCDIHTGYNDYELLEIFTLEKQAEFTNNLKEFIFKNSHQHYRSLYPKY